MDFGESAVTPVIGTILVLGISVAGIAATLLFGVPVIKRMQDSAALEATLGEFQQVRAEEMRLGSTGSSLDASLESHGGTLGMRTGTRMMVTTYTDPSVAFRECELRILSWDGDDKLTWSTPAGCRVPSVADTSDGDADNDIAPGDNLLIAGSSRDCYTGDSGAVVNLPPPAGSVSIPPLACFEAYRAIPGGLSTNQVSNSQPDCVGVLAVVFECANGVTLLETVDANEDWVFRVTDGASTVYFEAWLLHQDQLTWTRGSTRAVIESGTVFGYASSQWFLQADPAVKDSTAGGARTFLRLPMWLGTSFGTNDPGTHRFGATFNYGEARTQTVAASPAQKVRLDFQGDLAEAWCNTFLQRGADYRQEAGDVLRNCHPVLPLDGIRGLLFDPGGVVVGSSFSFTLVQQVMDARFEV